MMNYEICQSNRIMNNHGPPKSCSSLLGYFFRYRCGGMCSRQNWCDDRGEVTVEVEIFEARERATSEIFPCWTRTGGARSFIYTLLLKDSRHSMIVLLQETTRLLKGGSTSWKKPQPFLNVLLLEVKLFSVEGFGPMFPKVGLWNNRNHFLWFMALKTSLDCFYGHPVQFLRVYLLLCPIPECICQQAASCRLLPCYTSWL